MYEAVAAGIVSIVRCDTKYNQADMGTKSLNDQAHQFFYRIKDFHQSQQQGSVSQIKVLRSLVWYTRLMGGWS